MYSKKGGDLICIRPDSIVEARFKLTKKQNDIMDMVFANISDDDNLEYEIDLHKYVELYDVKDKSDIYGELKKAVKSFEGKGFKLTSKEDNREDYFSWFSRISYLNGEGKIVVELGYTLKKLFLELKRATFYNIKYSLNFNSIYSKRLYYYLKLYEDTGIRIDNIDVLKGKLECPNGYKNYADFNRYVLKPAYEEINGNSDIQFEYETKKTGRKITHIEFKIKSNKSRMINKPTSIDEVSATVSEDIEKDNNIESVKLIIKNRTDKLITNKSANEIYKCAIKNIEYNNALDLITEVAEYSKTQNIDNFVSWFKTTVKNFEKPIKNEVINPLKFNNFKGRDYDYDELEKKLLGWDIDEEEE